MHAGEGASRMNTGINSVLKVQYRQFYCYGFVRNPGEPLPVNQESTVDDNRGISFNCEITFYKKKVTGFSLFHGLRGCGKEELIQWRS